MHDPLFAVFYIIGILFLPEAGFVELEDLLVFLIFSHQDNPIILQIPVQTIIQAKGSNANITGSDGLSGSPHTHLSPCL